MMKVDRRTHGPPVSSSNPCHRHNLRSSGRGQVAGGSARTPAGQLRTAAHIPRTPPTAPVPRHHALLAVDIKGFNDPRRDHEIRRSLRLAMYDLLADAFNRSGLPWSECYHEDRGDGVLAIAPAGAPVITLLYPLAQQLLAGIRQYNRLRIEPAQIQLRTAVHAGQVAFDGHGVSGGAVTHLFRMLEAPAFKQALNASRADFALVTSDFVFGEVVQPGIGLLDPEMYAPIPIRCKETRAQAWLYLPPVRNPALGRATSRGRQATAQMRIVAGAVKRGSAGVNSAIAKLSAAQQAQRDQALSPAEPAAS